MSGYLPSAAFFNIVHQLTHSDRPDRPATVTYSVRNDGAYTPNGVAETAHTMFYTAWAAYIDNQVTFTQTAAYQGPTPSSNAGLFASIDTGNNTGAKAPISNAVLIHKRTAFIGRRNRGRSYIPFVLTESAVNEVGELTPSARNTFTTAAEVHRGGLENFDLPMMLTHSAPELGLPVEVTLVDADPVMGTQRRRVRR